MRMLWFSGALLLVTTLQSCAPHQAPPDESFDPAPRGIQTVEQLSPDIPAAKPERYAGIQLGEKWLNPYLQVCPNRIDMIVKSITTDRRAVAPADLRRALVDLPAFAWPYGRVIAVQECSIGASPNDEEMKQTLDAVRSILGELSLKVDPWPP